MTWGKFTVYVLIAYAVYYGITILLEMRGSKSKDSGMGDEEVFDLSGMSEEQEQRVQGVSKSSELEEHQKKNN